MSVIPEQNKASFPKAFIGNLHRFVVAVKRQAWAAYKTGAQGVKGCCMCERSEFTTARPECRFYSPRLRGFWYFLPAQKVQKINYPPDMKPEGRIL